MAGHVIRNTSGTAPVPCPCGEARRVITAADGAPFSVHHVTVQGRARPHFHSRLTECYVVLEGEGEIQLDEERFAIGPGDMVLIPPLTRHAASGDLRLLNIVSPPFDPSDEHPAG